MEKKVLMGRYDVGRQLGKGNFARVYYGRNLKTSQSVAIKVIDKSKVTKVGLIEQTKREISVMGLVKHPNVLQLYEVMATKTRIFFVLEYAKGGELFHKIAKGRLREDVARNYFRQLISAVDFCHSRGVYHRDLKPENLLLDEFGNLKVSDFGLSTYADCKRQDGLLYTTCGTPAYVAPDVICRKGYDGAKADIWSCGVILFVLLAGVLPFHDTNLMEMYRKISKAKYKCPNWFPSDVRKLLAKMLDPNPHTRISMSEIIANPWFKKNHAENKNLESSITSTPIIKEKLESDKISAMNAFEIISLSTGFDLSGLFVENYNQKEEVQFTSAKSAHDIISNLEEIAVKLNLDLTKKDGGLLKFETSKHGNNGWFSFEAEILEITPDFHLVILRKCDGDKLEFLKILKEEIKPGVEQIVWAWQGENQENGVIANDASSSFVHS